MEENKNYLSDGRRVTSTLYTPGLKLNERRAGNTTKQADYAIQAFYNGDVVIVQDHYKNGNHIESNYALLRKINARINSELGFSETAKAMIDYNVSVIFSIPDSIEADAIEDYVGFVKQQVRIIKNKSKE